MEATQIIQILVTKGFDRINKTKIVDLLSNQSLILIKYDFIKNFYRNQIMKEKEQIEEAK